MGIVDRPVEHEPEEKPDQLGRHLLRIKAEYPDEWRDVYETSNRGTATRIEGCLIGRGDGRIAGADETDHWEARLIERTEPDEKGEPKTVYAVRAKYHTKPHGKDWRRKPKESKKAEAPEAPKVDEHPETARVDRAHLEKLRKGESLPAADPEQLAAAGLDVPKS